MNPKISGITILNLVLVILLCNVMNARKWMPLFNGENLEGWEHVDSGNFEVADGILKTEGGMEFLYYQEEAFKNVVLRVAYKNPEGENAGVFIRIPEPFNNAWMPVNKGYEVQIDEYGDDFHRTGVLYSLSEALASPSKPGHWNALEVTLQGDKTHMEINGILVTEFREGHQVPEKNIWVEPESVGHGR